MDLRERTDDPRASATMRHPWEVARARFIEGLLKGTALARGDRVLDVGAGDAWLAASVQRAFDVTVTCWDRHYTDADLQSLTAQGLHPCRAAPEGPFEVVMLCDVLEHAEDDRALLATAVERLKPGGRLLVTVPAWPALFSAHDRALHHHRRYTPAALRTLLEGAGLVLDESGGLFHSLLAPRALSVLGERLGERLGIPLRETVAGVGAWRGSAWLTGAFVAALTAEQRLTHLAARLRLDVPGLSAWALATRPIWQSGQP